MTPPSTRRPPPASGFPTTVSGGWYASAAVVTTLAGVGVGHLVASLVSPSSAPVLAVGATVIDATPTPVKEWAVATFGTADKAVLVGSVAAVTLVAAGAIGLLARDRRRLALGLLAALALSAVLAAALRPAASWVVVVPGLATSVVGVLAARWLFSLLDQWGAARADPAFGAGPDHTPRADGSSSRRHVLAAAASLGALAATSGGVGQVVSRNRTAGDVALPAAAEPLPALPTGLGDRVPGISSFRTPNSQFYRIDTALVVPRVDVSSWTLTIDGDVETPLRLTYDELISMPLVAADITLTCVSNEVGGPYVGAARWLGVRTADLLQRVGVRTGVDQILSRSTDGMTISTPLQALTDDRGSLVAVGMNGEALPPVHGFPARLVTPGLFGFVGATKWLTRMTATSYAADRAYWTERGWATDAPIHTQSRIDTPQALSTVAAGRVLIGGVAWAQTRGIQQVEVRVDDGDWQRAVLGPDAGIDYWRQWYLPWQAAPGQHRLTVRATDATGDTQTDDDAAPFPSGATGWHDILVTVS